MKREKRLSLVQFISIFYYHLLRGHQTSWQKGLAILFLIYYKCKQTDHFLCRHIKFHQGISRGFSMIFSHYNTLINSIFVLDTLCITVCVFVLYVCVILPVCALYVSVYVTVCLCVYVYKLVCVSTCGLEYWCACLSV